MAMVAGEKPPASTPYLAQRRDRALSLTIGCSTRHWLDPFARIKSSLFLKVHGPSDRELVDKRQTEPVTYGHHNGGGGNLRQPPTTQE